MSLRDLIDELRFEHPIKFRGLMGFLIMLFAISVFMSIPPSPLMRAIGITVAQKKLLALYYAGFWQIRAAMHPVGDNEKVSTLYGNIAGLDVQGHLIISYPAGGKFVQSHVHIADARVNDLYGAAALIGQLRMEDAKFEVYKNNQVVVWIRDVPFNVKLIESGLAIPEPEPPTNIVDRAFSTYYWRIFYGSAS